MSLPKVRKGNCTNIRRKSTLGNERSESQLTEEIDLKEGHSCTETRHECNLK